jgi:hypothetical protein
VKHLFHALTRRKLTKVRSRSKPNDAPPANELIWFDQRAALSSSITRHHQGDTFSAMP